MHGGRVVVGVALWITSLYFHGVASGVDFDASFIEPLLIARFLHRIDLHFIAVPAGDLDVAIEVVQRNTAFGGERNRTVEILCDLRVGRGGETRQQRS